MPGPVHGDVNGSRSRYKAVNCRTMRGWLRCRTIRTFTTAANAGAEGANPSLHLQKQLFGSAADFAEAVIEGRTAVRI